MTPVQRILKIAAVGWLITLSSFCAAQNNPYTIGLGGTPQSRVVDVHEEYGKALAVFSESYNANKLHMSSKEKLPSFTALANPYTAFLSSLQQIGLGGMHSYVDLAFRTLLLDFSDKRVDPAKFMQKCVSKTESLLKQLTAIKDDLQISPDVQSTPYPSGARLTLYTYAAYGYQLQKNHVGDALTPLVQMPDGSTAATWTPGSFDQIYRGLYMYILEMPDDTQYSKSIDLVNSQGKHIVCSEHGTPPRTKADCEVNDGP